jgi:nucleoside-diphosphate-sugar epimerase
MKTAVLGGIGLLGSDLVRFLPPKLNVTPITRKNYSKYKNQKFDFFINANGNSKRFWALRNIYQDFEASTISVYKTIFDFNFKKYIYISSVDVYPSPSKPSRAVEDSVINTSKQNAYGFHKYISELIVKKHISDWIILRPSSILGTNLKKGPLYDILNSNPIFVNLNSKIQFITAKAIAEIIETLLDKSVTGEIYNVGGVGAFEFSKIQKYYTQRVRVSNEARKQAYNMDVSKLKQLYPRLKTSEEYLKQFIKDYRKKYKN